MHQLARIARTVAASLLPLMLAACTPAQIDAESAGGSADDELNYYSNDALEYVFEGQVSLTLDEKDREASPDDRLARAKELAELRSLAVGWFLDARITDKSLVGGQGEGVTTRTPQGFRAIVRAGGWTISKLAPTSDPLRYTYTLALGAAGQRELIQVMPGVALPGGKKRVTIQMPKLSNAQISRLAPGSEWYRDPQWSPESFDPSRVDPSQLERLDLVVSVAPRSRDAYLELPRLYEDGKLEIAIHYGWDYAGRYDILNAKETYDRLVGEGFKSPVESFGLYRGDVAPLTKRMRLGGREVSVEVRIVFAASEWTTGPSPTTEEGGRALADAMFRSLETADVIMYAGHAGQYYGFELGNWNATPAGSIGYEQLRGAQMPADRYQLVLVAGCQTFSMGQVFSENVNKLGLKNLDVITTNSFSPNMSNKDVLYLLDDLYGGSSPVFEPRSIDQMLTRINNSTALTSMYGLHGIDDNPRLHPFARLDRIGVRCSADADCGGPGNYCVRQGNTERLCAASCLEDAACPKGLRCREVRSSAGESLPAKQCVR